MFREDIPYEVSKPKYTKENWEIGFGLQAIDNLKPSEYLVELADLQIQGKIAYRELEENLRRYYENDANPEDSMEADFSSLRIAEILTMDGFTLSPITLLNYHKFLFSNVDGFAYPVGTFRNENITKSESVLDGDSVKYTDYPFLKDTLTWEFEQEREKSYQNLSDEAVAHQVMQFISSIWQVHPFREGNTRTIAVLAIKYLRNLGFEIDNTPFKNHSKYFRDALALANATRDKKTDKYLRMFTENALLGGRHALKI